MKKYNGTCPRCGETIVGVKGGPGFSGSRHPHGKGFHVHKKGNVKCLSCQSTIGVKLGEKVR